MSAIEPILNLAFSEGDDELDDVRASGVRRAIDPIDPSDASDVDAMACEPSSRRPTARAPKSWVFDGGPSEDDMYTKIVGSRLAAVANDAPVATPSLPSEAAPGTTRDLFIALGSLDRVPVATYTFPQLFAATLDPRHAFVLSLVDGRTSIASVIDASPMPMHQVLLILADLLSSRLIGLR